MLNDKKDIWKFIQIQEKDCGIDLKFWAGIGFYTNYKIRGKKKGHHNWGHHFLWSLLCV